MSSMHCTIVVALAVGIAAHHATAECPPEDFEGFAVGMVATNIVPGVTIRGVPGSCSGGVHAVIVDLGVNASSPTKAVGIEEGCPTLSPDYLRLVFDEPQIRVSFTIGEQSAMAGVDFAVRGYSEAGTLVWLRTFESGEGTRLLVEMAPSVTPIKSVEVESLIPLFETIDDLQFAGDTTPPFVEIDYPDFGRCLCGEGVLVSGEVGDPDGTYGCDTLAYRPVDADASAPWTEVSTSCGPHGGFLHNWNHSTVPDGLYYLRLAAYNECGLAASDVTVVRIDREAPEVFVAAPIAGSTVCGVVSVLGTIEDPCLEEIRLEYTGPGIGDFLPIATRTQQIHEVGLIGLWDTTELPDGDYVLRLRAEDACDNASSGLHEVTVAAGCGCLADLDGSGHIGFNDLSLLLGNWGACPMP